MNVPYDLKNFEVVGGEDYFTEERGRGVELKIQVQNHIVRHQIDFREGSLEPERFLESLEPVPLRRVSDAREQRDPPLDLAERRASELGSRCRLVEVHLEETRELGLRG